MTKEAIRFWLKTALFFFVIVAGLGLLMRLLFIKDVFGIDYYNIRQTHSHVAFLGWGYLSVSVGLITAFLKKEQERYSKYKKVLWLITFSILIMLVSFPIQGYGAVSISALIFFLLVSYFFTFTFLKDLKGIGKERLAKKFIKTALFYYLFSSLALWAIGPVMALGYKQTDIYYITVYFYLHFLYNGFFVFALMGLLFKLLDKKEILYSKQKGRQFYRLTHIACIPAFALSVLWTQPHLTLYGIAFFAAALQMLALLYFWPIIKTGWHSLKKLFSPISLTFLGISLAAYFAKLIMQLLSGLPFFAAKAYQAKSFVIVGYIHLVLIGFVSLFLLAYFIREKVFFANNRWSRLGLWVFLTGFLGSEALLFLKGLLLWFNSLGLSDFFIYIFIFSALMPLGLIVFFAGQFRKVKLANKSLSGFD